MNNLGGFFDVPNKQAELEKLEMQISAPDFWNDSKTAQTVTQARSLIEKKLSQQLRFETSVTDAEVLFEFAESDEDSLSELRTLIEKLAAQVNQAEIEALMNGENDSRNAICEINSGAGGTDAQ
ncbi:MAG: PCRF domain-containing protein, partial [Pyrinomonadaceae bacterium]|nr:PCRF domain-containing protein [Pyrinomonadaceae bacterium]